VVVEEGFAVEHNRLAAGGVEVQYCKMRRDFVVVEEGFVGEHSRLVAHTEVSGKNLVVADLVVEHNHRVADIGTLEYSFVEVEDLVAGHNRCIADNEALEQNLVVGDQVVKHSRLRVVEIRP
jgi:hypothetical protein